MLTQKGTIDPVDFVVASWPQIIYFIVCLGIFPPMMNLVFYHMQIVGVRGEYHVVQPQHDDA